jgi:hypothetical protein
MINYMYYIDGGVNGLMSGLLERVGLGSIPFEATLLSLYLWQ